MRLSWGPYEAGLRQWWLPHLGHFVISDRRHTLTETATPLLHTFHPNQRLFMFTELWGQQLPSPLSGRSLYEPFRMVRCSVLSTRLHQLRKSHVRKAVPGPGLHCPLAPTAERDATWWRCPKKAWAWAVEIAPPTGTGGFWKSRPLVCAPAKQAKWPLLTTQAHPKWSPRRRLPIFVGH